jgi:xanthine dehydrogenase accessory factor
VMVVDPDGGQIGTLGGGCVENEVKMKAGSRLGQSGAAVDSFILDHDYAWADGLICGGKMVILSEAVQGAGASAYYRTSLELLERGEGYTEAIVVDPVRSGIERVGARMLFGPAGEIVATLGLDRVPESVMTLVEPIDERPSPSVRSGVALLPTLPRVRLVIVGAGHVGQALGELAARADFEVWVVDDRAQYANKTRFPQASRIVVGPIDEVLPSLEVTPRSYAVIVTRGHGHDQEALYHLAPTEASYVGLIGSKRKIRLIFDSLRESGMGDEILDRVAAPVGLDIGSQSVFEIAVSIVAELIARRNLGTGASRTKSKVEGVSP